MIDPILITGVPRSGTSITAAMIFYGGAFGGDMKAPHKNKRNAMVENVELRNKFVKPYLGSIGYDRMGQNPLPNLKNFMLLNKLKRDGKGLCSPRVETVMKKQGYSKGPWFYKGPKMTILWPLWHAAFPNARWVIVHRDKEGIIDSCLRTSFMHAYTDREGWGRWIDHHLDCFKEMGQAGLNILHTYPENMIKGDFSEIESLVTTLGLNWEEQKAKELINPEFWGGNNGKPS